MVLAIVRPPTAWWRDESVTRPRARPLLLPRLPRALPRLPRRPDRVHPGVLGRPLSFGGPALERAAQPAVRRAGGGPGPRRGPGSRMRRGRRRHLAGPARLGRYRG